MELYCAPLFAAESPYTNHAVSALNGLPSAGTKSKINHTFFLISACFAVSMAKVVHSKMTKPVVGLPDRVPHIKCHKELQDKRLHCC